MRWKRFEYKIAGETAPIMINLDGQLNTDQLADSVLKQLQSLSIFMEVISKK